VVNGGVRICRSNESKEGMRDPFGSQAD
jgi:hypothetical protein